MLPGMDSQNLPALGLCLPVIIKAALHLRLQEVDQPKVANHWESTCPKLLIRLFPPSADAVTAAAAAAAAANTSGRVFVEDIPQTVQ